MTNRPTKRPANPYPSNKTTAKRPFVPPKETWTHDMCVLNKINANVTPTKEELERLRLAGENWFSLVKMPIFKNLLIFLWKSTRS